MRLYATNKMTVERVLKLYPWCTCMCTVNMWLLVKVGWPLLLQWGVYILLVKYRQTYISLCEKGWNIPLQSRGAEGMAVSPPSLRGVGGEEQMDSMHNKGIKEHELIL